MTTQPHIVTVSREFGSGGRELGKRLSDALGYAYFDREIVTALAQRCALDAHYLEDTQERSVGRGESNPCGQRLRCWRICFVVTA